MKGTNSRALDSEKSGPPTRKRRAPIPILGLLGLLTLAHTLDLRAQSDYPWVHYFDTPGYKDHPSIHFAFPDGDGNVIASTGDWILVYQDPSVYSYSYREGALYRIRQGDKEKIDAPPKTYVRDAVVDGEGRTWLIFGEARSYSYYSGASRLKDRGSPVTEYGYGWARFPYDVSAEMDGGLGETRFASLEGGRFVELPDVTSVVPARPAGICVDPEGHVFVMSREWHHGGRDWTGYFISWWGTGGPGSLRVLDLWEIIPHSYLLDYPRFGPDGLAYFLIAYPGEDPNRNDNAMLSLDPETGEQQLWDQREYPLLDSWVESFYVDSQNMKWVGTEDGLVRFDGETWMRCTAENTGLPYNLVRQIAYDEIDDAYYAVSEGADWVGGGDGGLPFAFAALSPSGERLGEALGLPVVGDTRLLMGNMHYIHQNAKCVFWLCPLRQSTVYSYDHERIMEWNATDWMDMVENVLCVGSTASGRTFCVAGTSQASCITVW